jgi:FkbM family methyltransferase
MLADCRIQASDEEVIRSFPRYEGPGVPGFVVDFLGTRTSTSQIALLAHLSGVVEGYPIPQNFHATALEWAGVLRAVCGTHGELTAIELGAGWAPWLVTAVRAGEMRGIRQFRLLGVEGSSHHCEAMRAHFAANGIDPSAHQLLHGVVGPMDGVAEFPILADPAADWGAEAVFSQRTGSAGRSPHARSYLTRVLSRACGAVMPPTERVPCFSLTTLLRPFANVDLVHVDIQGAEYEVIASAGEVLGEKVCWLIIATHGRSIERRLRHELGRGSWALVAEERCQYQRQRWKRQLCRDGCQVWRNTSPEIHTNLARGREP